MNARTYPVSIIVPAFNQLEYSRQCIESVLAHTSPPYQLILVDNGSTDGVSGFFDTVAGANVIHAGSNRGFAGGVNLGLKEASGHVVLLNSDTLVPDGWLERLESALLRDAETGMVGPMSNYVSGEQQIAELRFHTMEEISVFARAFSERNMGRRKETSRLVGFCLMIRDTVIKDVGLFDEQYDVGNYEDDDYCLRVRRAGYKLYIAEDCFVFHYGSRTFLGMGITGERWQALMQENQAKFAQKWQAQTPERHDAVQHSLQLNTGARALAEAGRTAEALGVLKEAIEVCPTLEQNYNDLGAILWTLGERERAMEQFMRAIRLNPDYKEAKDNLREAADALRTESAGGGARSSHENRNP
ncbi:MAG: glycosyltransferase [Candidatus Hydrogenedentes bacterium]|nr:glycosyltransferase [Candidatus Hydrogenedentota bacterium]